MSYRARDVLDDLNDASCRRLCRSRDLPAGGSLGDRRERLARSYRGDLRALLGDLQRDELKRVLNHRFPMDAEDADFQMTYLSQAAVQELRECAEAVYIDGWEPRSERDRPIP